MSTVWFELKWIRHYYSEISWTTYFKLKIIFQPTLGMPMGNKMQFSRLWKHRTSKDNHEWWRINNLYCTFKVRYRPRFFDQVGHQTTSAYIGNKHFFTKMCDRQTYPNSKISWQKKPISDFQSDFFMSKIIRIFLKFFFIEEYQFRST